MSELVGWVMLILPGILYIGQIISSINFPLAQRLGLQENPDHADPLLQRAERYTAYWDLVTLGWMPLAGFLMLVDHPTWPLVAFFAGAIYLDTSGREAMKILSFRHEGVRIGPPMQKRLFFSTYLIMAVLSITTLAYSLGAILDG